MIIMPHVETVVYYAVLEKTTNVSRGQRINCPFQSRDRTRGLCMTRNDTITNNDIKIEWGIRGYYCPHRWDLIVHLFVLWKVVLKGSILCFHQGFHGGLPDPII
jgi:hypothetical protein